MVSSKEMERRIRVLAEQEGRYRPVTVRHVDPATLRPAKPTQSANSNDRLAHTVRNLFARTPERVAQLKAENTVRGRIITLLEDRAGEWMRPRDIYAAVGCNPGSGSNQLTRLAEHGLLEVRGATSARAYRRREFTASE